MKEDIQARTREALRKKGLRATRQRLAVASMIASSKSPIGVKEIFECLVREGSKVGIATVYRVIALLEEAGVIERQPMIAGNAAQYHLPYHGSGQLVCSRCGKVEIIDKVPGFEKMRESVASQSDFATTEQSLYIIADCRNVECN